MVKRSKAPARGHTVLEVLMAYALFAALLAAAAPDPRPATQALRAGFESEVARGVLEGELVRAEGAWRRGEVPAPGPLEPGAWPAAAQLQRLALTRAVQADALGCALEVRATWTSRGDGRERSLTLAGWLRRPHREEAR